jgi:hypothetical protein
LDWVRLRRSLPLRISERIERLVEEDVYLHAKWAAKIARVGEVTRGAPGDTADSDAGNRLAPALSEPLKLVKDGKVIRGKDGWLFLANDVNKVLEQHSGALRLSEDQLERWQRLLDGRVAFVEDLGGRYITLVAPDTHAIYPEKLPDEIVPARERPIDQLLDGLEDPAAARFLYPLEELRAARAEQEVCSPQESHWNQFGAFIVYERLLDEVEAFLPLRRLPREELASFDLETRGELGYKLPGTGLAPRTFMVVRAGSARLIHDNQVQGQGALIVTECPDAPETTCLLFGDSYTYDLLKFVAESFGRMVFAHSTPLDRELVERERPDLVVSLMAERYLIVVPDDDAAPSLDERARTKREKGETRPKVLFWSDDHQSLSAIERMRTLLLAKERLADATIVSVLAYAGLRPAELQRLQWGHLGKREIRVRPPEADEGALDLAPERLVRLMEALADDLATWRRAQGAPGEAELVFPGPGGDRWSEEEWGAWEREVFEPAASACGLEEVPPVKLNDTFCSLLIYEGLSPEEVGRQTGYPAEMMLDTFRNRFWVARRSTPVPAERRIRLVRSDLGSRPS